MGDRKILNAAKQLTNRISDEELYKIWKDTLDIVIDSLESSVGFNARNTLIVHDKGDLNFANNVFTNDGITIIKNLEFISPIQSYISNFIKYIGRNIEMSVRDGTTTSMLITAYFIRGFIEKFLLDTKFSISNSKLNEFCRKLECVIDNLIKNLQQFKIDKNDKHLPIEKLIYYQAMITSKGNHKLSKYVSKMFKDIDVNLNGFFIYDRHNVETEEDYQLIEPTYEYILYCNAVNSEYFNKSLGMVYEKTSDLIVSMYPVLNNNKELDNITKYIDKSSNENLIIILGSNYDVNILEDLKEKYNNKKITFCTLYSLRENNLISNKALELKTLIAMSGNQEENILIKDLDILIQKGYLCIKNNLIKEREGYLNKLYKNKKSEFYNRLEKDLKEKVDKYNNNFFKANIENEYKHVVELYRYLVYPYMPIIKVGGNTLDVLANMVVIEDVVGSVTNSLDNGFIVDGILKVLYLLSKEISKDNILNDGILEKLLFDSFFKFYNLTKDKKFKIEKREDICDKYQFNDLFKYISLNINSYESVIDKYEPYENCIVQPFNLYIKFLERLKEFLPKIIKTNAVIIPGTVKINDKE